MCQGKKSPLASTRPFRHFDIAQCIALLNDRPLQLIQRPAIERHYPFLIDVMADENPER
jgi:hypothetical protein